MLSRLVGATLRLGAQPEALRRQVEEPAVGCGGRGGGERIETGLRLVRSGGGGGALDEDGADVEPRGGDHIVHLVVEDDL